MEHSFRIPAKYLRERYVLLALVAVVFSAGAVFVGVLTTEVAAFGVLSVVIVELLVYPLFKLRVWVTLSSEGVQARHFFGGRRALVEWRTPVEVRDYWPPKGERGVALYRVGPGAQPETFHSAFIPNAILWSKEFRASLACLAPQDHPLSQWVARDA
ncbi:hypothetical protein [Ramlibacter alkalitolerans]|uniref:DUF2244 domain-containing protein n=1 Tax=Ramlibacter alkalitolerans TaxID=2039631 RepID=A0ABS1JR33_9BURK|nr:hypothetical protein [Ramlibacter alkalitolerans]MBL0426719.1 hypothetical protein [Ramlibacter alkalitolerans]